MNEDTFYEREENAGKGCFAIGIVLAIFMASVTLLILYNGINSLINL